MSLTPADADHKIEGKAGGWKPIFSRCWDINNVSEAGEKDLGNFSLYVQVV